MRILLLVLAGCGRIAFDARLVGDSVDGSIQDGSAAACPISLAAGISHTCVANDDGTVWCWGDNASGQLGDGTMQARSVPMPVPGVADAIQVAANGTHTCALTSAGTVWCWGANSNGQLGDGTLVAHASAALVPAISGAQEILTGVTHTCARLASGAIACWGSNGNGELGDGTTMDRPTPVMVSGLSDAVQIGGEGCHTCARRSSGTASCWGCNYYGELGNGATSPQQPTQVPVMGISNPTTLFVGRYHTCAIVAGAVWCWGINDGGQLGDNNTSIQRTLPAQVAGLAGVVMLSGTHRATCARTPDGMLWCWGYDINGQLADGGTSNLVVPTAIGIAGTDVTDVAGGLGHACMWHANGAVWCAGLNTSGQLGDGTMTSSVTPVLARPACR
jgi:alpha-tubulin suppressor-like RCC1 family protein